MEHENGIIGIAHIALNVPDLELARKQYAALGFIEDARGTIVEESFGIAAKIMRLGAYTLELCAPLDGDASTGAKAYGLDHICYATANLDAQMERLKANRFAQLSPKRVSGVWNKTVVLMANRKMGVIELMEEA